MQNSQDLNGRLITLQEQFEIILQKLFDRKKQKKIIHNNKIKRKNRGRSSKREPITTDVYTVLISQTKVINY